MDIPVNIKLNQLKFKTLYSIICILAFVLPNSVQAAGWSIDPIRIELTPTKQTAALTFTNDTDQPTTVQIQAVSWSQVDGKDIFMPTRDLLISPPIITIAPKSTQLIRMTLRIPADATKELAYRVNLQELPEATATNESGVKLAMRVGIPVFIQSRKGNAAPKMSWKISSTPENMVKVELRNDGDAHVQISDFSLYTLGSEQIIATESGSSYILAGQSHDWLLKSNNTEPVNAGRLHLKAYTDAENIDKVIVLDKP